MELRLQVGELLQLQARDGESSRRMQVRVIGYLPGQSLIVTTPRSKGNVIIMREGQPFVGRMLVGNRIVGFATKVLRSCARPYPYLHLAYPEELEQIVVRQAQRIAVRLFVSVDNDNPEFKHLHHRAQAVDISTSGALLLAGEALGEVGDRLLLTCAVKIGDTEKLLRIPSWLRNVQTTQDDDHVIDESYYHGVEFDIQDQQDALALHGFVYEQIVKAQTE